MGTQKQQIIAMGGGGFSMEPDNLLLDEYVVQAAGKPDPVVCFLRELPVRFLGDAQSR